MGTSNRYKIKKLISSPERETKRVSSERWNLSNEYFEYENQLKMIKDISNNNLNHASKIAIQEINKKISSYKQQDKFKKLEYSETTFLTFSSIINKMIESELKCRYCKHEMNVLYDISRELKQWSVDRIDNNLGHTIDNYHLACLECNLTRRRKTDEKFLFTKQLNIVKHD